MVIRVSDGGRRVGTLMCCGIPAAEKAKRDANVRKSTGMTAGGMLADECGDGRCRVGDVGRGRPAIAGTQRAWVHIV